MALQGRMLRQPRAVPAREDPRLAVGQIADAGLA
jgi:hypothetical protein